MYGSMFRMKALPGKRDEVIQTVNDWTNEVGKHPDHKVHTGYLLKSDANSDEVFGLAIADDEAAYRANNDVPGQAEWYGKLRALLAEDPQWHDGEVFESIDD